MLTYKSGRSTYKKKDYNPDSWKAKKIKTSGQQPADYAKTLINPWLDLGVRIPDLSSMPTSTFQYQKNFVWTVTNTNANTNNSILIVDLAENPGYFFCNGFAAAGTEGVWTGGTLATTVTALAPAASTMASFYDLFRVVSAGVKVKFADSDTATKGVIWGATAGATMESAQISSATKSSPFTAVNATSPWPLNNASRWNDQVGVYCGPLSEGIVLRYAPSDSKCFQMIKPDTDLRTTQIFNYGRLAIAIDGLAVGDTRSLLVEIVCNIEAIPTGSQSTQVQLKQSTANGAALDAGLNAATAAECVFGGSDESVNRNINNIVRYLNTI